MAKKRDEQENPAGRLTENALTVLKKRYLAKDGQGKPVETPEGLFRRVARNIALIDILYHEEVFDREGGQPVHPDGGEEAARRWGGHPEGMGAYAGEEALQQIQDLRIGGEPLTVYDLQTLYRAYGRLNREGKMKVDFPGVLEALRRHLSRVEESQEELYRMMTSLEFCFNSPTLMNAGRELQQLSACFVLPIEDSLPSIFGTLKDAALIHQSGGGTGFSFSRLRPKDDIVRTTGGVASGPVSFLRVYNAATEAVKQGGCVAPDTRIATARGLVKIRDLGPAEAPPDSWHPHCGGNLTVMTDDGPRASDEFYNHGVGKVIRLRTKHGYSVTATPKHRFRVLDRQGRYVWRHLKDIRPGDWVVLQKGTYMEVGDYRFPEFKYRPRFSGGRMTLPTGPTPELGEFLGYFTGHGAVSFNSRGSGRVVLSVSDSEAEMASRLPGHLQRLFGLAPRRGKKAPAGSTIYFINSTVLARWLDHLGAGKISAVEARVPEVVFRAGPGFARAFLRGLFSADGTVSRDGYPFLSSPSAGLVEDVQQLLLALGVPTSVSRVSRRQKGSGDNPIYHLRVITLDGLHRFATQIGFMTAAKNERLQAGLKKARELLKVILNQQLALASIYEGLSQSYGPGSAPAGADRPLDRSIHDLLAGTTEPGNLAARSRLLLLAGKHHRLLNGSLARFLADDQFYDQVVELEEGESLTLDLSVPANNTYIANGFVSHNTRRGANMGILRVDHPDIEEFITCKQDNRDITNFNISVGLTEEFMKAVEEDATYELINPRTRKPTKTLRVREVFEKIVEMAWKNGEPGIIFLDRVNEDNPTPRAGEIESTNPCFHPDTLINTERGLERIEDLFLRVGSGNCLVLIDNRVAGKTMVVNGRSCLVPGTSVRSGRVILTGVRDTVKVVLANGMELKVTPEHRLLTTEGWREAGKLRPGDQVLVQSGPGMFPQEDALGVGLGLFLGWHIGDGWLTKKGTGGIPRFIFTASKPTVRAFLQGLFCADGTVNSTGEMHRDIRLSSTSKALLQDVQLLLLNMGVYSRIYERPDGVKRCFTYTPVCGEPGRYQGGDFYDLIINGDDLAVFKEEIGFPFHQEKQSRLEAIARKSRKKTRYIARVKDVVPAETVPVYDISEPVTRSLIASGVVVHNCGEQPLLPHESCNLGSINLGLMVRDGKIDFERLGAVTRASVHYLDNIIDANRYPLEEIERMTWANRKIGLGVMGFADLLIKLGIPYDSERAVEVARGVMEYIDYQSKVASVELARERGAFPNFRGSIYDCKAPLARKEARSTTGGLPGRPPLDWRALGREVARHGIRNATTTTIAPTGTISIICGATSGIEPIFSVSFVRNVLDNQRLVEVNPLFEEMARKGGFYSRELMEKIAETGSVQALPEVPPEVRRLFVTALEIPPDWHIRIQAAFQEFTDNATSKTVNCPHHATVEDIERIYRLAYQLGCKGVTVYRDGSREVQVLTRGKKQAGSGEEKREQVGTEAAVTSPEKVSYGHWGKIRPVDRPRRLMGITDAKQTPMGNLYLTLNVLDGHPFELFAQIGKAGSDVTAFTEAIARLISLAFRSGIDPREVAHQLKGIGGSRSVGYGPGRVRSVPDAIGQFIEEYLSGAYPDALPEAPRGISAGTPVGTSPGKPDKSGKPAKAGSTSPPANNPAAGHHAPAPGYEAASGTLDLFSVKPGSSFNLCHACGSNALVFEEGCAKCLSCGHSEC